MSTLALPRVEPISPAPKARWSPWKVWGVIFLAPYVVIFFVFVLYPVLYGLWLARHPECTACEIRFDVVAVRGRRLERIRAAF